ncbi:hypothetical protein NDU88_001189 [Pleurodeles waltl]|uniref:Uncharacterized protein n=1 Tax=Pleurodeles waltl TaxID=8319 RepID=A0AAV7US39_PLEWA|nr:hypothetical protein NDU88_001189 [Pleurodeles waltl]
MLDRLLTSRPIRIEDGRDVGGGARGTGKRSARDAAGCARSGSSWALLFNGRKNKERLKRKCNCLASLISATTNGDEGHSF